MDRIRAFCCANMQVYVFPPTSLYISFHPTLDTLMLSSTLASIIGALPGSQHRHIIMETTTPLAHSLRDTSFLHVDRYRAGDSGMPRGASPFRIADAGAALLDSDNH